MWITFLAVYIIPPMPDAATSLSHLSRHVHGRETVIHFGNRKAFVYVSESVCVVSAKLKCADIHTKSELPTCHGLHTAERWPTQKHNETHIRTHTQLAVKMSQE